MKKSEFVMLNPNLNANPKSKIVPNNLTPERHLDNAIHLLSDLGISKTLQKTFKETGMQDIIDAAIAGKIPLKTAAMGVVGFFEEQGKLKQGHNLDMTNENKNKKRNTYSN